MGKFAWLIAGFASIAVLGLGSCTDQKEEAGESLTRQGVTPIGGEGRPKSIEAAIGQDSEVPLFQIGDQDTVLYILPTVHFMRPTLEWKRPIIEAVFKQAQALYLPADVFSKEAQRSMGLIATQAGILPDEKEIGTLLNDRQRATFDDAVRGLGADPSRLKAFRPWFATLQLEMLSIMYGGGDPAAAPDVLLAREMMQRGARLRYLETAAQQMAMRAAGTNEEDIAVLFDRIELWKKGEAYYADLLGAWYGGDMTRLEEFHDILYDGHPELRERLVRDRNFEWALQMDRLLTDDKGVYLLAIPYEHLVGADSLLSIMTDRGYEPERL